MASSTTTTPVDLVADTTNRSCRPLKPGRSRCMPVEYRVVSITVRGNKASVIARLLELTPPIPKLEPA